MVCSTPLKIWSTSLYHIIPINYTHQLYHIIPYYPTHHQPVLVLVSPKVRSQISAPQSSTVVPECPTLSRFLQSTASARCPTNILKGRPQKDGKQLIYTEWIWFPWRIHVIICNYAMYGDMDPINIPQSCSHFSTSTMDPSWDWILPKIDFSRGNPGKKCQENYLLRPQSQKSSQLPWPFGHFIHPSRAESRVYPSRMNWGLFMISASFWGRCAWINYPLVM